MPLPPNRRAKSFNGCTMGRRATPTRAALKRARQQYEAGEPVAKIAASLGIIDSTFLRWRRAQGWPERARASGQKTSASPATVVRAARRKAPNAAGPASEKIANDVAGMAHADSVDINLAEASIADADIAVALARVIRAPTLRHLIEGLQVAIAGEMKAFLESNDGKRGGEARTRVLANFARTLSLVRALAGQAVADDAGLKPHDETDAPPVDVAELRAELARRLHRLTEGGNDS